MAETMSQNFDTTSQRSFIATAAVAASSFTSIKLALAQPTQQAMQVSQWIA
jgi:hypothetical protein